MDQHVPRAITVGLRIRGVDVLTAFEDGASEWNDSAVLDRATELGRVVFTQDDDFLVEANRRVHLGIAFGGIVYAHQMRVSIGVCVNQLEIIAKTADRLDVTNSVFFLPL
ncbi:MAG TPA: DUF5615 family PIN-like protein [Anaerolineae bacterium]|jgi:hypothetical protein